MRTTICALIALSLLTIAPAAFADPSEGTEEEDQAKCVEVDLDNDPPVYVYECPDWPPAP